MHICMHLNTLKIFDREIRCNWTSHVTNLEVCKHFLPTNVNLSSFVIIVANEATGPKIGTSLEKVMMSALRLQINYTDNSEIATTVIQQWKYQS